MKTNTVSIKESRGLSSSPQPSPHKNPNKYKGEVLANQGVTSKKTHNKTSAIIMQNCIKAKLEAIKIEFTSEVWKIWKI